ncbi:unnamed protein product [Oppiella nova]|uniref:Membralin n=1 Tax=Oppiella nova TaxID=334625 RepID=A0A7R9LUZ3_9ACAR|nr:unnamed protein product [Oppiella nova]CAG2167189.1 unnamed protein product [Oppiella nova]
MSLNRLIGAPLMAAAFPRIIRIVIGQGGHGGHGANIDNNIAININNININNNNNDEPQDVSLVRIRARLFRVLFFKIAVVYALSVPTALRKLIEWSVLVTALLSLAVLCHLHLSFIRTPIHCLDHIQNEWPRDGILRVQILNDPHDHHMNAGTSDERPMADNDILADSKNSTIGFEFSVNSEEQALTDKTMDKDLTTNEHLEPISDSNGEGVSDPNGGHIAAKDNDYYTNLSGIAVKDLVDYSNQINNNNENNGYPQPLKDKVSHLQMIARAVWPHESYIVEYSLEYGFLRLSARARQRLQIPIKVVTLDPRDNRCFGDVFSRTLLSNFLGYDDILMGSLKNLAEKENNRGYVRNVITGEHYRFVNIWMTRASYIAAAFIMLVFTLSISMLLRYSHHQVFVFVAQLMQTLESNIHLSYQTFPAAPLLTVILALVGMQSMGFEN